MKNRTISTVLFGLLLLSLLAMLPIGWMAYSPIVVPSKISGQHLMKSPTEHYGDIANAVVDRVHESMMTYGGQTDQRRLYAWNFIEEFPALDINPELSEPLADKLNSVHEDMVSSAYTYHGTENIIQIQVPDGKAYVVCYHAGKNPKGANIRFAIAEYDYFFQSILPDAYQLICAQSDDEIASSVPVGSVDRSSLSVYLQAPDEKQDDVILSDTELSKEELFDPARNVGFGRVALGDLGHLWVIGPKQLLHTETIAMMWLLALWFVALCLATVLFIRELRLSGDTT